MDMTAGRAPIQLTNGAMILLRHSQGRCIAVFDGMVWITQEGDPDDVFLRAGESFALAQPGLSIVQALEDSHVFVFEADTPDRLHGKPPSGLQLQWAPQPVQSACNAAGLK
jgi:Protein of unknown function (DUF2917)